jgi:hypothetical protein
MEIVSFVFGDKLIRVSLLEISECMDNNILNGRILMF